MAPAPARPRSPTVETALALELEGGAVIADDLEGRRCVFLAGFYRAEREIAEKLKALAIGRPPWPAIDADKAIQWVEQRTKLALADSQREAVRVALASKVLVITGGPGVGKTTLVNSILQILIAKTVAISLCAPTGRAAKRLSESTGLEAKTIHRLLETDPRTGGFSRNEDAPLDCDLLVLDETSMVDVPPTRTNCTSPEEPCAARRGIWACSPIKRRTTGSGASHARKATPAGAKMCRRFLSRAGSALVGLPRAEKSAKMRFRETMEIE